KIRVAKGDILLNTDTLDDFRFASKPTATLDVILQDSLLQALCTLYRKKLRPAFYSYLRQTGLVFLIAFFFFQQEPIVSMWPHGKQIRPVGDLGEFVLAENFRSEEHTSELQSRENLVCRLLLEKKKKHWLVK